MKGDLTRDTFIPEKHYSGVRMQQGRLLLDAEFNEYVDIQAHLARTTRRDVIGPCGGPQGQDNEGEPLAGFEIEIDTDNVIRIKKGRYYVDGILCENEDEIPITEQPDLPVDDVIDVIWPSLASLENGPYLAYLDVWHRHITALEDDVIREVALGGQDTTTRIKTVCQVKLLHLPDADIKLIHCASELQKWQEATAPSDGQLRARVETETIESDPCVVPARAGYRGLENQLYRVEVHRVISDDEITIKWSRENGSVIAKWEKQDSVDTNKLTLNSAGRDSVLGFRPDDWIELTDDTRELHGRPGILAQVTNVSGRVITINPDTIEMNGPEESNSLDIDNFAPTRKVRRWDMAGDTGEITVNLNAAEPDKWIELENGIWVAFEPGKFHTGDYWMIPARTASRDIEWPRDDDKALPQPPHGIHHHYCPLAVLEYHETANGTSWDRIHDCRKLFPPSTEMVRFFYLGGDGQEAMPHDPDLHQPLRVGVLNGQMPVENARVRFKIEKIEEEDDTGGELRAGGNPGTVVYVESGPDGVYECEWSLDPNVDRYSQRVEASLIEIDGKPMADDDEISFLPPIHFNANLSMANKVSYNPGECNINPGRPETVKDALDQLCLNTALYYVSGDGQEVRPGGKDKKAGWLPHKLQVRVANGLWPAVKDTPVVFEITQGKKTCKLRSDSETGDKVTAKTDEYGLAECEWRLDNDNASQQVVAYLKDVKGPPIRFNANLSVAREITYDPKKCDNLEAAGADTVQKAIDVLCKNGGSNPGIRIVDIRTKLGDKRLRHDGTITIKEFLDGLQIVCDRKIEPKTIVNKPTCFVTLDIPFPLNEVDQEIWGRALIGFQPLILNGGANTLGEEANIDKDIIFWQPAGNIENWLETVFSRSAEFSLVTRILAHLTLKGSFIWAADRPHDFLYGEALGDPTGGTEHNLQLPRGDGRRGGDFEMWFWLSGG